MLVYATWQFFSREHKGKMENERGQACLLLLALLLISWAGLMMH